MTAKVIIRSGRVNRLVVQSPTGPLVAMRVTVGGSTPSGPIPQFYTAGEAINGHRAVALNLSGNLMHFSQTLIDVIGISVSAGAAGNSIQLVSSGDVTEPSWSWTPGLPIYAGTNGSLTQTPPTTGWFVVVGNALASNKMRVEPEPPILLA